MRSLVLAGCVMAAALSPAHAADCEANTELYRHYTEDIWIKHDPSAVERYLAPNFVEHNQALAPGRDGRWGFVSEVITAFPDYHPEIQEVVADGDRLVARVQWTGTQDGPYEGRPPTHNKLVFSTADFFRFENGKIAEHLGRGQCAPTHDCAWPDPAAGGCDGKAALAFAQQKRAGSFPIRPPQTQLFQLTRPDAMEETPGRARPCRAGSETRSRNSDPGLARAARLLRVRQP